jgi:HAMP domain-containing protein
MQLRSGLLRTRVARRILGLFVTGALVPVVVMAGISFVAVTRQLTHQSEERLRQLAANAGQSIVQQLLLTQGALHRLAFLVANAEAGSAGFADAVPLAVEALTVSDGRGAYLELVGDLPSAPPLDSVQRVHLAGGQMLIEAGWGPRGLLAAMALDSTDLGRGVLWARLTPDSIWAPGNAFTDLSTRADFCLLGAADAVLFCDSGTDDVATAFRSSGVGNTHAGVIHHDAGGRALITGYRRLLLEPAFAAPTWTVLVSEADESVYAPLNSFRYSFPLSLMLGLLAVLLLANVQVRRTMEPLGALEEGTKQVAAGDLSARVPVTSKDEFGMLANSFNRMAGRLGLQFRQLQARRAIDEAVLRAVAQEDVVSAVLSHFGSVIPSRGVSMILVEDDVRGTAHLRQWNELGEGKRQEVRLTRADVSWIGAQPHHRTLRNDEPSLPGFLDGAGAGGAWGTCVVLPLMVAEQVRGVLWYEPEDGGVFDAAAMERAREITDQATVALDDLRLTAELEEMSWGTLRALARAIDVKSKWTAGHSERVTELALEIGIEMELGERELTILSRGGLLHDVGKIGVPARILDMDGALSPVDRAIIEQHPVIGGRILEPIRAFGPTLPIVTQHHERWDGEGYPAGLKGEEIDPLARILAVADVYDAMASARPYRNALAPVTVVSQIERDRGTHFEPRPVDAFLRVMARRGVVPNGGAGDSDA